MIKKYSSAYIDKFTNWTHNIGLKPSPSSHELKSELETSLNNQTSDNESMQSNKRFVNRLFELIKNLNTITKTKDKFNNDLDDYIEESGILTVICLSKIQSTDNDETNDESLKYAYCRPVNKRSIDTNLLDDERMFKLKGLHITLANLMEKLTKDENLIESKLALPRITLLRSQELTKINFIYEQEDSLLVKFAIANTDNYNFLSSTQFKKLSKSIIKLIKFRFDTLENAFLNLSNQMQLTKLFNVISFLLNDQCPMSNRVNLELSTDFYLCEQLTVSVELLQCIQQVMIDYECLTWINEFEKRKEFICLNSVIFYKGRLICSNIYQRNDNSHSDLKIYLKLSGLLVLNRFAQIKLVNWLPIYSSSSKCYLLVIVVEHILYATIWKVEKMNQTPKQLINEGLHFIVRLIKKTSLIEEIDYEFRLQTYWYSIPISLDEFKDKRGHILQKSFELYNLYSSSQIKVESLNRLNQYRKALISANIHRNQHLNNELIRKSSFSTKNYKQKLTGFNILNNNLGDNNSALYSIYNSLRSNDSSSTSFSQKSVLFDPINDPFANELQCELSALTRSFQQIRQFMVDYLVCFLVQDNQNSIYQSPILSSTFLKRLGGNHLFIKKFKQNCFKLENQLCFLNAWSNNVQEIGLTFESRLPILLNNSNKNRDKVILPLSKSSPNIQSSNSSSFKTVKFWLQLIRLDSNRLIYLCFLDNFLQQKAIQNFLFNNSSRFK